MPYKDFITKIQREMICPLIQFPKLTNQSFGIVFHKKNAHKKIKDWTGAEN